MAFCLFITAIMGIVAIANLIFARKLGHELGAAEDKPSQEESSEQAAID
jgi:hypothetical protein